MSKAPSLKLLALAALLTTTACGDLFASSSAASFSSPINLA